MEGAAAEGGVVHGSECAALEEKSRDMLQRLSTAPPQQVDGVTPEELAALYTMPPHIPKPAWTELGDLIKAHG